MAYDNDLIAGKLRRWEKYLERYRLPAWEEIPDFGLYMEQVVQLLKQYLSYLPPELKQSQTITAAAINNYVRTKMLPEPRKKKYYRIHIAYLLMICTLKQSLSLSMLQTLLTGDLPEDEVKRAYTAYALRHRLCAQYFVDQVKLSAAAMLELDMATSLRIEAGRPADVNAIAAALLLELSRMRREFLSRKSDWIAAFSRNCLTVGKDIQILRAGTVRQAKATGIGPDAELLVEYPDGTSGSVSSGEVSVRGLYGYV